MLQGRVSLQSLLLQWTLGNGNETITPTLCLKIAVAYSDAKADI